jgi:hypothetical protein
MSEATTHFVETEAEPESDSEAWGMPESEAEPEGQEEAWPESDRSRRERQMRMLRARQQAQLRRQPAPGPRRPQPTAPQRMTRVSGPSASQVREVQSDVISLGLDTEASLSRIRRDLDAADRMAYRNAVAAEASAASALAVVTWGDTLANYAWARALLIGAPTFLLAPRRKRVPGFEGIISDPRVFGGLALALIWGVGHWTNESRASSLAHSIQLTGPSELPAGNSIPVSVEVLDGRNNPVANVSVTYNSSNEAAATVNNQGQLTAVAKGVTAITATATTATGATVTSQPIYVTVK